MKLKGIALFAFAQLSVLSAFAIETRLRLPAGGEGARLEGPGGVPSAVAAPLRASFGTWVVDGADLQKGFKGEPEYVLSRDAYIPDRDVDLLLHLDTAPVDSAGGYEVGVGSSYFIDTGRAAFGAGAGSFRGPKSALELKPKAGSLLAKDSRFRDFSIEFWLKPANAENGEVILLWRSVRKLASGILPQQFSCVIAGGRIVWNFSNFFYPPEGWNSSVPAFNLELRARSPLIPLDWSHHLLRFDYDTGLVEYLVDGNPEAIAYATALGREGGSVFPPAVGAASPLAVGADFSGLMDEFRLSRRFVETPNLKPYGKDPALLVSPVADLGFARSRLLGIEAEFKSPGNAGLEFSYRIAEDWAGWSLDRPEWKPFSPGATFQEAVLGRYVQVRAELFPDGSGTFSPSLSSFSVRYEPDPPPPPPARLLGISHDGAVELRWSRVPESDLVGYLVYYGDGTGEYMGRGAAEGPSPVDAGQNLTFKLSGLPNGKLLYIAVAAYDSAIQPASRAGEFSEEISIRPSRTIR